MQSSCDSSGNSFEVAAEDGGVPEESGEAAISGPSQIGHGNLKSLTAKAVKRSAPSYTNQSCSADEASTLSESKEQ